MSCDSDFLKLALSRPPALFPWHSCGFLIPCGWRRKDRQLLFTEMSGIATVTPGHSHSVRYHTQSFNSREGTEVGHPVKPIGIPVCSDLSGPP